MTLAKLLQSKRPIFMGILNLTPDSFSDGGIFNSNKKAIKRVQKLEKEGADIIDIGGESTGPNSPHVSVEEELKRVIPILKAIRKITKLPISIDTYKSEVARQALQEGANLINDVTAMRSDPKMAEIIKKSNCPIILMYSKDKSPRTTIKAQKYTNIIQTISKFFTERLQYAQKNGIKKSQIIIDPGMGQFISSIPRYSMEIISRLYELKKFRLPIAIGISRKSLLPGTLSERDQIGLAPTAIAYLNGASIIRTHNVQLTREYLKNIL